ncbi:glycine zipper 2TM domain-containing protein [Caballeronia sordidicola]|uniref:Outer membrane lipoprotein n=1 Tax=Caballeronia sordidicola TaxID=196367 RepID=A0A242M3S6_CABSO|nr:glycine zipper 2TM domain-containing protein [Caballeronia sordidicola]OTP65739.1 Outer membrane lipoprotein [Caballeronia sordidicola]
MSENVNLSQSQRSRIHPLVAAAAVAVIVASGVGVAALTGILPASRAVPAPMATPLMEGQVSGPNVLKQTSEKQVVSSAPSTAHHHYEATNERDRAPTQAARVPLADPYAGEVVAGNVVRTAEPTTGLGALGGAVLGGLAGTQVGNGRGRTAATIVGALGGGLAGNTVQHAVHKATSYNVQVRMSDGSYRNFSYQDEPGFQVGQRVRISGDRLSAS